MNIERPLSVSIIIELMLEAIHDTTFCQEITRRYDFYNAGGAHRDNLFWLVEILAVRKGYIPEDIKISIMAWGAPRSLLYEGSTTNFNFVEIGRLSEAFNRLLNDNILAPGMYGNSQSLPYFHISSGEENIYIAIFGEKFWELIHPKIIVVSKSRYQSGQFADSVEAAFKEVNSAVKSVYLDQTGQEKDGSDLMFRAFSLSNPIIRLSDLSSESEKNIQNGYMQIFAGAMIGIRNPKAHENLVINRERAIHFLFLASLLMHKLDERKT